MNLTAWICESQFGDISEIDRYLIKGVFSPTVLFEVADLVVNLLFSQFHCWPAKVLRIVGIGMATPICLEITFIMCLLLKYRIVALKWDLGT